MRTFKLPDLGEGLSEAEIVNWHVSAGDRVVADQPLVSVETDKAVVEVPSPYSGTVVALHAKAGDIVPIDFLARAIDRSRCQGDVIPHVDREVGPLACKHEWPADHRDSRGDDRVSEELRAQSGGIT